MQQARFDVRYSGRVVGEYVADLIVGGTVIVEVKALRALERVHDSQALNYLKATRLPVALLLNFGRPRLEYRRLLGNS
jgi:GxxExxY protein